MTEQNPIKHNSDLVKEAREPGMGDSWTQNGLAFSPFYFRLNGGCYKCHTQNKAL
jgi:hypothetical protein